MKDTTNMPKQIVLIIKITVQLEDYRDGYQQGFEIGYNAGFDKRSFDAALPANLAKRGVVAVKTVNRTR